jgi:hypothetical protein
VSVEASGAVNNVENNLFSDRRKSRAGRPEVINDEALQTARDYLVSLLEKTWGQIGWNLQTIKTQADVTTALRGWEKYRDHYVVDALLRQSDGDATAKPLRTLRSQLYRLKISAHDASLSQQSIQDFVQELNGAECLPNVTKEDQRIIVDERRELTLAIALREREFLSLNDQYQEIELSLRRAEAHFAQDQLLRFCKSRRYTMTPLRTANALAGLPFIGWRQSGKRCSRWKHSSGAEYRIFQTVQRILKDYKKCNQQMDIPSYAHRWLENRPQAGRVSAISEFQWNWYYLRKSIQAALAARAHPKQLPYLITRLFFEKSESPSAVDSILEYRERITPRSRKIKVS